MTGNIFLHEKKFAVKGMLYHFPVVSTSVYRLITNVINDKIHLSKHHSLCSFIPLYNVV